MTARGRFYTELFAAFPDNAFALSRDRGRSAGRVRGRDADRHEPGTVGRAPPSGLPVSLEVIILFPWDPDTERFLGERIWFDRGALPG